MISLVIFTKYIPGKIWTILGRATRIKSENYPVHELSVISLKEQLVFIWVGLAISIVPMIVYYGSSKITWLVFLLFAAITLMLLSRFIQQVAGKVFKKLFKRQLGLPGLRFKEFLNIMVYCLVCWIIWIVAFFFLIRSVYPEASFTLAFAFPMSAVLGLLAIVVPGGIGVREGLMVGFLTLMGLEIQLATTISLLSRLWFVIGEAFIFLAGWLSKGNKIAQSYSKDTQRATTE